MNFHQISCVLYIGLLWDIIHSGHKLCAYRIHIVGSETFEGIFFLRNILRDLGTIKLYFLCLELCFKFLLINIENI